MAAHGFEIEPELSETDHVIPTLVEDRNRIRDAGRSREAMAPAQPGEAKAAGTRLAELLVDVALFPPEAAKGRMEADPRTLAAAEDAHPLHRDLEWFGLWIESACIRRD